MIIQMKLFILLSVLSVVALVAAMPPAEVDESNIVDHEDESLIPLDRSNRLLVRRQFIVSGVANRVHTVNYTWRGAASTRISSWRVSRVGAAQGSSVVRTGGGVGTNNLSLRMTSARGRGFNYIVEIWGR